MTPKKKDQPDPDEQAPVPPVEGQQGEGLEPEGEPAPFDDGDE